MDHVALKTEVQTDPTGKGYSAYLPHAPGMVVALLNAQTETMIKSRYVTARTVLAECVGGAVILDKLEAATGASPAIRWAVRFLGQDSGLDVGNPVTLTMIDQLAGSVLDEPEADALRNLGLQAASRAEVLGLGTITEADLRTALEM